MTRFNIVSGPSKPDLEQVFFRGDSGRRRTVAFWLEDSEAQRAGLLRAVLPIVLNSMEWEDGSGDNWNFKGYYPGSIKGSPAHGFYSTDTCKGWVEVGF